MIMKQLLYILLLLPVIGNAQFGKKISELPKVDALTSADLVPVVQNGKNYSATVSKFANASVPDTVTGTHLFTGVVQLDSVQLTGNSVVLRPVSVSKDSLTGALGRGCASDCYWLLNGNAGTDPDVNFIGTTDSKDLVFKTKNTESFRLDTNGYFKINNSTTKKIYSGALGVGIENGIYYTDDALIGIYATDNDLNNAEIQLSTNGELFFSGNSEIRFSNSITISDGTQGAGKVLTSDASGNATWSNQILTGSATLDFGTIAPNGHETLTITVTGAALGDVVSLGIPNSSTNDHGAFMAWVSATDTVSVKCYNFDGVSFDPASGTFTAKIFK